MELGPLEAIFDKTEEEFAQAGGENAEMFRNRIKIAISSIHQATKSDNCDLIVAHSGVYRMMVTISDKKEPATEMYNAEVPENAALLELSI